MFNVLEDERLNGAPLLVFANKQDLPEAMSITEVTRKLELEKLNKSREWKVLSTCAVSGSYRSGVS